MKPITQALLNWYAENKRDLPWRRTQNPYHIWVAEVMLQQTRVNTVVDYYCRFIDSYPTLSSLAQAREEEVLTLWQGLGYYSRARHLLQGAKSLGKGPFPHHYQEFLSLPGVGEYTASAVFSIAFQEKRVAVDGNILRIAIRLFSLEEKKSRASLKRMIQERLLDYLPEKRPGDFNQALMDLGSGICIPKKPPCPQCPLQSWCQARIKGIVSQLPIPGWRAGPRKTPVQVDWITTWDEKILLRKRSHGTFLQGLWELPFLEGGGTWMEKWSAKNHWPPLEETGTFSHRYLFTHKDWQMTVRKYLVPESFPLGTWEYEEYRWFLFQQIAELSMATVFRQVLEQKK